MAAASNVAAHSSSLVGLRLALAKLARRKGNAALAQRLVRGVAPSGEEWAGLRRRYEEILLLRSKGQHGAALGALWEATQSMLTVSKVSDPKEEEPPAKSMEEAAPVPSLLDIQRAQEEKERRQREADKEAQVYGGLGRRI